ncbi:hypothetical protein EYZ11_005120 [Aspergillus tanneri]|uniref:ABC transporter domain-containing protein n=1 Tax=Aspergillus tanneri TaxID=1220188 RepID=A0A4S3JIQ9_9EURO|nr:hypothetical protein EYZ11_005120 [Aspergillus tanneri]
MKTSLGGLNGPDIEKNDYQFLMNDTVTTFSWSDLTVTVKDSRTKHPHNLIDGSNGVVQQGELVALMGPSGCGKTTLLNVLARRTASSGAKVTGDSYVNGNKMDNATFGRITSYVEQEDALIGSLTVQETLKFAADLSLPRSISKYQRAERIQTLLSAFGIHGQASTLVGTPIRKGISGGQKRRVSVASQLITCPKILFLDEPTSGLDSTASYEVISYVKKLAVVNNLIIIASIHQPSTSTFQLFDKLLLLSEGKTCYFGPVPAVPSYFDSIGLPIPSNTNPAEYLLDIVSSDFTVHQSQADRVQSAWTQSTERTALVQHLHDDAAANKKVVTDARRRPTMFQITLTLLHRLFIKSYRDVVAYGIRIVMYLCLAIMMGTVWLRLHTSQEYIQPFINAIFFGSAFMSFMAVAYVPAFLEDRATFIKERANVSYFLSNFHPSATSFFIYTMWLFLDLVAAESLVVFVTSVVPNFVIALALVAFANGLWMSVGGFLVSKTILNPFWKFVFHYIDYQCLIQGKGVLNHYGYSTGRTGKWVGILIGIIAVYRLFGYVALVLRT